MWVRLSQLIVHDWCKQGRFKVPVHLALGHEAIAVALDSVLQEDDHLLLSHRNIHYNLARVDSLKPEIDEYLLKASGLAGGQLGSMNLANESKGLAYTSSILGNNLAVAAGFSLANQIKGLNNAVFVVTGDGAMEEGTFYESLLFERSNALPVVVIIENNHWSLATKIEERRCPIDTQMLARSLDVPYERLAGNDVLHYIERLSELRALAITSHTPVCVEVMLTTLGWWRQTTDEYPDGKFINYHCGPSPSLKLESGHCLARSEEDPLFVLEAHLSEIHIRKVADEILTVLQREFE